MNRRVLISGAFADSRYGFGFFEHIARALEADGVQVDRFNAFGFGDGTRGMAKWLERLATFPARLVGIGKQRVRAMLPWTPDGRRERALVAAVKAFEPDTLIVVTGFRYLPSTLQRCRELGVKSLVGWYVEGPLESGLPESQSLLFDRYFCIHRELAAGYLDRIGWLPSYGLDSQTFHRLRFPRSPQPRIVFVGTATERRIRFLEALQDLPLELWGPKWDKVTTLASLHRGDFIWGEALNSLYNDSAVVLNIASWNGHLTGMTQRIVEIPSSGALMLTDDAPEIAAIFEAGSEMDVFDTPEQLRTLCLRYLADSSERERIADRGHHRALALPDFRFAAKVLIGAAAAPVFTRAPPGSRRR